jgi:two-component system response regulator NreC
MTDIVLADDHEVVRQGLRALLEAEPDFVIVGEASNGKEAIELAKNMRPGVMVLDLMMPGISGLEVARRINKTCPKTRIVVLSMYANEAYVLQALKNGASAYVIKDASARELITAIREVILGNRYLSPPLSESALEEYVRMESEADLDLYDTLTKRELEVLHLAAEGLKNPEVAAKLSISTRTVEAHRSHLMRKLGLRSQTELVRYALARGILPNASAASLDKEN